MEFRGEPCSAEVLEVRCSAAHVGHTAQHVVRTDTVVVGVTLLVAVQVDALQ